MPQITLNFTNEQATRSLAATLGLHPKPDTDNPATGEPWTDAAWWKRCLIKHLKQDVFNWEVKQAKDAAIASVETDPDVAS